MNQLFEYGDIINNPMECFYFDSEKHGFPVQAHWHYYMEIIYMLSGVTTITVDDATYRVSAGDMILFHPQAVHAITSEAPVYYAVLKFDINVLNMFQGSSLKFRNIFRNARADAMPVLFPAGTFPQYDASSAFRRCIEEIYSQNYGSTQLIQSKISEMLIEIIRYWISQGFVIDNVSYHEDGYDIYSITDYIDTHLTADISVPEIAEACNMSYSYFAKKFPAVYGKTCKEYLEEQRLYKVEEYLLFTNFDLAYIARETGFADCSHLIKSFKKRHGITPKKFRDEKKQ